MLFQLGQVVATKGIMETLSYTDINSALIRHGNGDWGDVCSEDKKLNDQAVKEGMRLLSSYKSEGGERFWIITEWDRSVTTILFPDEY